MPQIKYFLMHKDSQVLYVNESACNQLGYTQEELLGKYAWVLDRTYGQNTRIFKLSTGRNQEKSSTLTFTDTIMKVWRTFFCSYL
jgi:PAS domain S-box-containing protein